MSSFDTPESSSEDKSSRGRRLSYKFQRLRERIRNAVTSGEFNGKLPGERVLARRFKVNAKTLSKALTDLAAEGLLERNIGLGTFVRGAASPRTQHKCLVLHDPDQADCPVLRAMIQEGDLDVHLHDARTELPPSLLNPFRSVMVCSQSLDERSLRDLVVRGKMVVQLDRSGAGYSTHGVCTDLLSDAIDLGRRLWRSGHRRLMLLGAESPAELQQELLTLLDPELDLRAGTPDDLRSAVDQGVTGVICTSVNVARSVLDLCAAHQIAVPDTLSVGALGRLQDEPPCSGNFVKIRDVVNAVLHLINDAPTHRPISLWLSGQYLDRRTIGRQTESVLDPSSLQYARSDEM